MTRINVVDPETLTNKHLLAEYRELPRIFGYVKKLQEKGLTPSDVDIPDRYVLGKGHVKFFTNKCSFLVQRQKRIIKELSRRGYTLSYTNVESMVDGIKKEWNNEYYPTDEDIKINVGRIEDRLEASEKKRQRE